MKMGLTTLVFLFVYSGAVLFLSGCKLTPTQLRNVKAEQETQLHEKIWKKDSQTGKTTYKVGNHTAKFSRKNSGPEFFAIVSNQSPGYPTGIRFIFRGACAEQMTINGRFAHGGDKNPNNERYKKSGKGEDLPIHGLLKPLVKGLSDQCEQLTSIRLVMPFNQYHTYKGTLNKSAGWTLEDDSQVPPEKIVSISTRGRLGSKLVVDFNGKCLENTTMHIKSSKDNWRWNDAYLFDFVNEARAATSRFIKECPEVEEINFTLDFLPEYKRCKPGTSCTLITKKSNGWQVDDSNFEYPPELGRVVKNYDDILKYLGKSELDTLDDNPKLFKTFFEDYLYNLGNYCPSLIRTPVKITTYLFEQQYDGYGNKLSEEAVGEPSTVILEKSLVPMFEKFQQQNAANYAGDLWRAWRNAMKSGSFTGLNYAIYKRLDNKPYIESHLRRNCNSESVSRVYKNMLKYAEKL